MEKITSTHGINPIINNVAPMPGNFQIQENLPVNDLPIGTLCKLDGDEAIILASAKCYAGSTGTAQKVYKEHSYYVGATYNGETVTAIDQTNEDYDVFTVASMTTLTNTVYYSDTNADGAVVIVGQDGANLSINAFSVLDSRKMPNYWRMYIDSPHVVMLPENKVDDETDIVSTDFTTSQTLVPTARKTVFYGSSESAITISADLTALREGDEIHLIIAEVDASAYDLTFSGDFDLYSSRTKIEILSSGILSVSFIYSDERMRLSNVTSTANPLS